MSAEPEAEGGIEVQGGALEPGAVRAAVRSAVPRVRAGTGEGHARAGPAWGWRPGGSAVPHGPSMLLAGWLVSMGGAMGGVLGGPSPHLTGAG